MITIAIQRGDWVYVYGDNNQQLCSLNGELYGFTSTTVSIKRGSWIYVYDARGVQQSSYSC